MTHAELLSWLRNRSQHNRYVRALMTVAELHSPTAVPKSCVPAGMVANECSICGGWHYPCDTITGITEALGLGEVEG